MINGQEYGFEDIDLVINGVVITGFDSVEYGTEKVKENVIGRGNKPVARARGTKNHTASIGLHQSEVEAIQATLSRGQDLTDIKPFPIVISYAPEGGVITTDILKTVEVTKVNKAITKDDTHMIVPLELIVGDIDYNAARSL